MNLAVRIIHRCDSCLHILSYISTLNLQEVLIFSSFIPPTLFNFPSMHSKILPFLWASIGFLSGAAAQTIQRCDPDLCPPARGGLANCPLGDDNTSNVSVGITNFTAPFSPSPFTWTTTLSTAYNKSSGNDTFERKYFLGYPTDVRLNSTDNTTGCALFFHGLSRNLNFAGIDFLDSTGTCQDALGDLCMKDLLSQAQDILAQNLPANTTVCSALQVKLSNATVPESCRFMNNGGYGKMIAKGNNTIVPFLVRHA